MIIFYKQITYKFYQEGDLKYTSVNVRFYLLYSWEELSKLPYPPDLYPIEHAWSKLEKKIRKHNFFFKSCTKATLIGER
ncbi:hypothetical protein X975_14474, partial [Stegodyphus mimosarum]